MMTIRIPTIYQDYIAPRYYTWALVPAWWEKADVVWWYETEFGSLPPRCEQITYDTRRNIRLWRAGPIRVSTDSPQQYSWHHS